ncbi:hypothetical protein BCF58_2974 [Chryseobacterium defluvii]|uniref:Uncharacterized protein n=1 Tax=Chryseobacterium defluvii TaxID=160396 RepID=A0A495S9H5_9FLAO|nr:hypothetical protein BCF58_2974 [Chryseobacterium defluvii]
MKTSLKNYSVQAGILLMLLAAFFFGFNLYKVIAHFKSSDFAQTLLFSAIAITIISKLCRTLKEE